MVKKALVKKDSSKSGSDSDSSDDDVTSKKDNVKLASVSDETSESSSESEEEVKETIKSNKVSSKKDETTSKDDDNKKKSQNDPLAIARFKELSMTIDMHKKEIQGKEKLIRELEKEQEKYRKVIFKDYVSFETKAARKKERSSNKNHGILEYRPIPKPIIEFVTLDFVKKFCNDKEVQYDGDETLMRSTNANSMIWNRLKDTKEVIDSKLSAASKKTKKFLNLTDTDANLQYVHLSNKTRVYYSTSQVAST
jgi:hypothetical protein